MESTAGEGNESISSNITNKDEKNDRNEANAITQPPNK